MGTRNGLFPIMDSNAFLFFFPTNFLIDRLKNTAVKGGKSEYIIKGLNHQLKLLFELVQPNKRS